VRWGDASPPIVHASRAAAFGDINNDGRIDVVVVNRDGPACVLKNVSPSGDHWLMLRVLDEHGRDALGARVQATIDKRTMTREVRTAHSYLAGSDPRVHFGLGNLKAASNVTVTWVDGVMESFGELTANRIHVLKRGGGEPAVRK
jgi:hypothetical protein